MSLILTSSVREETAKGSGDGASVDGSAGCRLPIVTANFLFEAVGSAAVECDPSCGEWSACALAWLRANGLVPVWSKAFGTVAMKQMEWYAYRDRCRCAQSGKVGSEVAK